MRLVKIALAGLVATLAIAQQPIAAGPDNSAGWTGISRYFNWYGATPSGGCTNTTTGACVGPAVQGDTYYWTGWLPNASGLPVTNGLPIVGTANDYNMVSCGGNLGVAQLDKWSWAAPTASHVTKINCMTDYGTAPGSQDNPAGWHGHLSSADVNQIGTWKNRQVFSRGGLLYMPIERQITTGVPSAHDATFIMSPDSGQHWCNPYTLYNIGTNPGVCNSSKWSATGDAPKCDAASASTPCTNAGYLDTTHSSMMFQGMPYGTENWIWVNYLNQDGTAPPVTTDGCDPATYVCFVRQDGAVMRTTNVMDKSASQYYTCPAITMSTRCAGSNSGSWSSTYASITPTFTTGVYTLASAQTAPIVYAVQYIKEFGSYCLSGLTWTGLATQSLDLMCAPAPYGPYVTSFSSTSGTSIYGSFMAASPALGYTVVTTNPPRVKLTFNSNNYSGGEGSPEIYELDLVLGRQPLEGEAFRFQSLPRYQAGAGYQFSSGHIAGSFPSEGMIWSFDYLDYGYNTALTRIPYYVDSGNRSAVMVACDAGYTAPNACGNMNPGHGTSMNVYGASEAANTGYGGHFRTFPSEFSGYTTALNAPSAMQGNGSYSVIGVYRYEGVTSFGRAGGIWSTGVSSTNDNTMVEFNQYNGTLALEWNATYKPRYLYVSNFTFPSTVPNTTWYFIAVTVQAQGSCGSTCTPKANIWVGGAVTPGVLTNTTASAIYTAATGTTPAVAAKTPNVSAGPLVIGMNANGESTSMTVATTMVYSRSLTYPEVQLMYQSLKAKMKARGATLQ